MIAPGSSWQSSRKALSLALLSAHRLASSPRAETHFLRSVFDSAAQPLLAGVRGASAGRQLLYQKENCCIDIRLEPRAGRQIEMVGQVLDSGAIGRGLDQIPVSLQKGDTLGPNYGREQGTFIIACGFSSKDLKDDLATNPVSPDLL